MPHRDERPIANPYVMLREEFDDWAILFNPDTGRGFGLSPTGVYVWKLLDGEHSIDALLEEISGSADSLPHDAKDHIRVFIDALGAEGLAGLAGYDDTGESFRENRPHTPLADVNAVKLGTYEPPKLIDFTGGRQASGTTCSTQGSQGGSCGTGAGAYSCCNSGGCRDTTDSCCLTGDCASDPASTVCCNGTCAFQPGTNCYGGGQNPYTCPGPVCLGSGMSPYP